MLIKVPEVKKPYRVGDDFNYFGSDYNKFCRKCCTPKMTVNNIDVVQYKIFYGQNKTYLRITESKHRNEGYGRNQRAILELFAKIFSEFNESQNEYEFQSYVVRADFVDNGDAPPTDGGEVENLITGLTKELSFDELVKFSSFEMDV